MFDDVEKSGKGFGGFDESWDVAEIIFLGAPLKSPNSPNVGVTKSPEGIRRASLELESFLPTSGIEIFEEISVGDIGNISNSLNFKKSREKIMEITEKIIEKGKIPALLGGEHLVSELAVANMNNPFILFLDAHRDLRETYRNEKISHATIARRMLDLVPSERLIQVGVRSCSKKEEEFSSRENIPTFAAREVINNPSNVLREINDLIDDNPVYLSIDLDVLDPAFAPAVTTPAPGGLSSLDLLDLLRGFRKLDIQGFDLVELDSNQVGKKNTSIVAAKVIYEILGVLGESD